MRKFLILLALTLAPTSLSAGGPLKVAVTAYTASPGETDARPDLSACGRTFSGQLAVSRDLLRKFPCGSRVRLTINGHTQTYVVNDTMNARWTMKVDVLKRSRAEAFRFGRKTGYIQ